MTAPGILEAYPRRHLKGASTDVLNSRAERTEADHTMVLNQGMAGKSNRLFSRMRESHAWPNRGPPNGGVHIAREAKDRVAAPSSGVSQTVPMERGVLHLNCEASALYSTPY